MDDGPKDEVDMRISCTSTQLFHVECEMSLLDWLTLVVGDGHLEWSNGKSSEAVLILSLTLAEPV